MQAFWCAFDVLPVTAIPIELLDSIGTIAGALARSACECTQQATYLEPIWVFVGRPATSVGIEEQTLLIFVGNVVVHVLSNSELPMKLDNVNEL